MTQGAGKVYSKKLLPQSRPVRIGRLFPFAQYSAFISSLGSKNARYGPGVFRIVRFLCRAGNAAGRRRAAPNTSRRLAPFPLRRMFAPMPPLCKGRGTALRWRDCVSTATRFDKTVFSFFYNPSVSSADSSLYTREPNGRDGLGADPLPPCLPHKKEPARKGSLLRELSP